MALNADLLRTYCAKALDNAGELQTEAKLLCSHGHFARAYFLAVASIEEAGKAYLAFDGQGRRLEDGKVAASLLRALGDHSRKIYTAFVPWLTATQNFRDSLMVAVKLMGDLKRGREPSMYTDLLLDSATVQSPREVIRERAARDCTRLAEQVLFHAKRYVSNNQPAQRKAAEDQLYVLKSNDLQKIVKTEDFWRFYLARVEAGLPDWSEAVVAYRAKHLGTGIPFRGSDT